MPTAWRRVLAPHTLTVIGYPRTVRPGWLEPLITAPGHTDIALHIAPVAARLAADRLRRQRARLESTRRLSGDRGRLPDPGLDAAADDAEDLAGRLARGDGRLFRVGLTLTCWARSDGELDRHLDAIRALCSALLLDARPVPSRALEGWGAGVLPAADERFVHDVFGEQPVRRVA